MQKTFLAEKNGLVKTQRQERDSSSSENSYSCTEQIRGGALKWGSARQPVGQEQSMMGFSHIRPFGHCFLVSIPSAVAQDLTDDEHVIAVGWTNESCGRLRAELWGNADT